jgi:hypothetical protein
MAAGDVLVSQPFSWAHVCAGVMQGPAVWCDRRTDNNLPVVTVHEFRQKVKMIRCKKLQT